MKKTMARGHPPCDFESTCPKCSEWICYEKGKGWFCDDCKMIASISTELDETFIRDKVYDIFIDMFHYNEIPHTNQKAMDSICDETEKKEVHFMRSIR